MRLQQYQETVHYQLHNEVLQDRLLPEGLYRGPPVNFQSQQLTMSIDSYDVYYDEMDSSSDSDSIAEDFSHLLDPPSSSLQLLSTDVVVGNILPFLRQKKTLAAIAMVSKHFRDILFSEDAEHIWNHGKSTFHLCIDSYCTTCMMKKKSQLKGSHFGSIGFLKKFPIENLRLHCFVQDIPECVQALSTRKYLKTLDLTLSNKSNCPPLEDLLGQSCFYQTSSTHLNPESDSTETRSMLPELEELTLDSSHLQHVNLAGRARLLDILGASLETLTFSGLSPAGIFSILSSRCPSVKKLRVDKASSFQDMMTYSSTVLEELELHRASFLLQPKCLDNYPSLMSLRYTPSFRCDSAQMEGIIAAAPAVLRTLSLELPSLTANDVLNAISRRLFLIESLSIQGSYECGMLSEESLLKISRKCLFMTHLEVASTKSVSDITMDVSAFMTLSKCPSLKYVRLKYDDSLVSSLSAMLRQSDSVKNVTFWERKKWIKADKWILMSKQIEIVQREFPNRKIKLEAII